MSQRLVPSRKARDAADGRRRVRSLLLGSAAMALGSTFPAASWAAPAGGSVVQGAATITQSGTSTVIDQSTDKAIIDWRRFGLEANESARFNQPGSGSIALNRVTGGDPSVILGALSANGSVWLVNPNGVMFGPNARVDVHGLIATTADIHNDDFMSGRYDFSIPSPDPTAAVVNLGTITFDQAGLAALVAPYVRNQGTIVGELGQVVIAGVPTFGIDFQGDGLLRFAATSAITQSNGTVPVENTGVISVDGGRILVTAEAAENVVDNVINAGGVIEARSVALRSGEIVLSGGDHGAVVVSGTVSTAAKADDSGNAQIKGGDIDVLGDRLMLADGSRLDASGPAGGGDIHIGGDYRGEGDRQRASQTVIAPGAEVVADATVNGNGGQVVAWADDRVVFAGDISSRGGPGGGNGGQVETSSPGELAVSGTVQADAPAGEAGSWLLDPKDVYVIPDDTGTKVSPVFASDPPKNGVATISVASLNAATSEIIIQATNNITVRATLVTGQNISFSAGNQLIIKRPVTTTGDIRIAAREAKTTDDGLVTAHRLIIESVNPKPGGVEPPEYLEVDMLGNVDELVVGTSSASNGRFYDVEFVNQKSLTLGIEGEGGIAALKQVEIEVDGTLTIAQPIVAGVRGDAIILVADNVVNNAGADAIQPERGRFLIYSDNPQLDDLGGLPAEVVYSKDYANSPPETIGGTGNVIVYAVPAVNPPSVPPSVPPVDPPVTIPFLTIVPTDEQRQVATRVLQEGELSSEASASHSGDSMEAASIFLSQQLLIAPPPSADAAAGDVLFANDGNRELWY